jgi:predicted dehydrogenase
VAGIADPTPSDGPAQALSRHVDTTDSLALIRNPEVDAIVVATPVSSHFDLAIRRWPPASVLRKAAHLHFRQALRLIAEAEKKADSDHRTFVYQRGRKIRERVLNGELGQLYY